MVAWIALYQASHQLEAHALKGALEVAGVPVRLSGGGLQGAIGELPVDLLQVTLMVPSHALDDASAVLAAYLKQPEAGWRCGHCGEENGASFEVCWRCGQERED